MTKAQYQEQEAALRSYLLGQSSHEEQKQIEQQLLGDSDFFNELQRMEESLTDEYVRGEIQGAEKQQFDHHFLKSQEHQRDLEFARLLNRYFAGDKGPESLLPAPPLIAPWRSLLGVAAMCAAIVLVAASVFLLREVVNLRSEVRRLQAENAGAQQREQSLAGQLQQQQQQMAALTQQFAAVQNPGPLNDSNTVSVILAPGLDRSATEMQAASLPARAQWLRLQLNLEDSDYVAYQAEVQTVEGGVIWSRKGLKAHSTSKRNRFVELMLPASIINRSDYLVVLNGSGQSGNLEKAGTYYLNVKKNNN